MSERKLKKVACKSKIFLNAMVFFLDEEQLAVVEEALLLLDRCVEGKTRAARKAMSLTLLAERYIKQQKQFTKKG